MKKVLTPLSIFALILMFLTGCNTDNETNAKTDDQEEKQFPVEVSKIEVGTLDEEIKLPGNVMASELSIVIPMLTGEIKKVHVQNGDFVNKGDALVEIDTADIQLNVEQARAGLTAAEANLKNAQAMRAQGIKQAEMQVNQAKEMVKALKEAQSQAQANLPNLDEVPKELQDILKSLLAGNIPTDKDIEQAERAVKQAEMALEQANSTAQITAVEASVKQAQLGVQMAEKQAKNGVITAPISGQVSGFKSKVGQFASPQSPLMQIVQMTNPIVQLNVNEALLSRLEVGQNVEIQIKSLNETFSGKVKYIGIMPAEQSRSYPVEIEIETNNEKIRVGMVAEVVIQSGSAVEQVLIPIDAIVEDQSEKVVFVTKDGETVERRRVEIEAETQNWLSVQSGVSKGEFVIVKGTHQLYDGAKINIRNMEVFEGK